MADFRRWFTMLAVLALMACAASAQVGVANGSASSQLYCSALAAGTPEMRPEGYTELAGDIIITCTGGPIYQVGANIPTTNIVVYITPSVPLTSRYMSSNGASEALLIIDEAGSNITTGASGPYGTNAPQVLCTYAQETSNVSGNVGDACSLKVGTDYSNTYLVAVPNTGAGNSATSAQNVFQGKVGDFGVNTVTFYDVPVLPPATSGVSRTFRITNVRVPAVSLSIGGSIQAFLSTSPNQTLPLTQNSITLGVVGPAMSAAVKQVKTAFQQCQPQTVQLSANLIFTEGFATGFKTRVVPGGASNGGANNAAGNVLYAAEATNTSAPGLNSNNQNIPGGLYGGFSANVESGFIMPSLVTNNTGSGSLNYIAGLADYGSRLKAVFYNIPAGLTMYVSVTSAGVAPTSAPAPVGGTSVLPYAVLVGTNSGEATPDSNAGTGFSPITSTTKGSDGLFAIALSANSSGAATAVWEVTNSNPSAQDTLQFSVYISYAATSPSATNPYGTPITGLPLGTPPTDVQLSYAPEPSGGTFTTANATQGQVPTPRFAVIKTQEGPWTTINLCQTTLLYPFVTGAAGFDTGIAVANTSWDPFGTINQTGSCKLWAYGVTVAAAGNTPLQTTVPGCDTLANPVPGTNCFPIVPAGQVQSVLASATLTNFQGYVIAVCNFQYAHGYAAVTDLGIRNLWSSYLALELAPEQGITCTTTTTSTTCTSSGGVGSPRTGVSSIEELVH